MPDDAAQLALRLIEDRRTIVLATAGDAPWAAPVYYLWRGGRFWFFSSPRSRHITEAFGTGRCAGAVFRGGDDWRDIEGLQMEGTVERVPLEGAEAAGVYAAYLERFTTVRGFFDGEKPGLEAFTAKFRSEMYAFAPDVALYLNNRAGFANRVEVQLPG